MKAIILAAGRSTRLYPVTLKRPKCLLEIKGKTIIDYQIELLNKAGIKDILVVTGYLNSEIQDHLKNKVRYEHFPDFAKTNNLYTLNSISKQLDDEFICLFSDVLFPPSLLKDLIDSTDDFCLLMHNKKVLEGTMRVKIKDDSIYDIGSHIPPEKGDGNFIGIAKFSKKGAKVLSEEISRLVSTEEYINDYYTIALPFLYRKGYKISFICVNDRPWIEIDTKEDFDKAGSLIDDIC